MEVLALYVILCTGASFLLARAKITEWLWSKYPAWLDYYLSCTACSGFALGVGCAAIGGWCFDFDFLSFPAHSWMAVLASGCAAMVLVPILAWAQTSALINFGDVSTNTPPVTDQGSVSDHTSEGS
jgi:hypothetical protein